MPNTFFQFKKFRINQAQSGMKVTTDACLFGAWVAAELTVEAPETSSILDIGTGTGLLSLMIAQKLQKVKIDAVEINEAAFNEARNNFNNSSWQDRLTCWHSSIQDFKGGAYNVIVCNPPFFSSSQLGTSATKNLAIHELDLSSDQLLFCIQNLLVTSGRFYLLYPEREMNTFIDKAKKVNLHPQKLVKVYNQENTQIFRVMACFQHKATAPSNADIFIRASKGSYTSDFWSLLKDYYLEYNNPSND